MSLAAECYRTLKVLGDVEFLVVLPAAAIRGRRRQVGARRDAKMSGRFATRGCVRLDVEFGGLDVGFSGRRVPRRPVRTLGTTCSSCRCGRPRADAPRS